MGLSITRDVGSSFTIGKEITVRVIDIKKGQVKLNIDAPREMPILRDNAKERK